MSSDSKNFITGHDVTLLTNFRVTFSEDTVLRCQGLTLVIGGEALGSPLYRLDPLGLCGNVSLHQGVGLEQVQHVVQMLPAVLGLQPALRGTHTTRHDQGVEDWFEYKYYQWKTPV